MKAYLVVKEFGGVEERVLIKEMRPACGGGFMIQTIDGCEHMLRYDDSAGDNWIEFDYS
jgi:hypothetical protein